MAMDLLRGKSIQESKDLLTSNSLLVHFNPSQAYFIVRCFIWDGAVLSQIDKQGVEKPVAYASRTLSQPERNYS